jgi:hypothetical protein
MVKSGFLKTIKKNMSSKKIFIILGLLSVIIVILFSCVNNYSIENFKPKPNVKLEIYLWVGPYGSLQNELVQRWLDFTNEYGNIPNITLGRAKVSEFTKYLELDKNPKSKLDTNKVLEPLKSIDLTKDNEFFPFVSIFYVQTLEGKVYKNPIYLITGKNVTYDVLSKSLNSFTTTFNDALYESDVNVAPVVPVVPPTASTASAAITEIPWA